MEQCPKVSVCIASYNHARYLPAALDSVLAQTFRDFEVVIVDDGSTDDSLAIAEGYAARCPSVKVFTHPHGANRGISASANLACERSCGEYLAWLGSDDLWCPDKLEHQVALLNSDPSIGLVYNPIHFIDESGQRLPDLYDVVDISRDPNPIACMIDLCHVPAMSAVIRRECLRNGEFFDESLVYGDWELWIRILAHWRLGFIDKPLAMYRIHGKNTSKGISQQVDLRNALAVMTALQNKAISAGGALATPRNRAKINLHLAYLFFCAGDIKNAKKSFDLALEIDASLSRDVEYFNKWLESNKGDYGMPASYFQVWAISLLTSAKGHHNVKAPHVWETSVLRKIYPSLLFESQKAGDSRRVRHFWLKTIQYDPSWLRNRGMWSIGVEALLGRRAAGWFRGLIRKARTVRHPR